MNEFKAGDMVYSPTEGTKVFTVEDRGLGFTYDLTIGNQTANRCGKIISSQNYPSIFHATKENQALLEALYGVKFDDPPLSDKEKVIESLKNANGKPVLCWASNSQEFWCLQGITNHHPINGFLSPYGGYWSYAKPIAPDEFVLA